jgi:hypothetical protein
MLEELFLLLIFTVLCGILVALWRIREQLEKMAGTPALDKPAAQGSVKDESRTSPSNSPVERA